MKKNFNWELGSHRIQKNPAYKWKKSFYIWTWNQTETRKKSKSKLNTTVTGTLCESVKFFKKENEKGD